MKLKLLATATSLGVLALHSAAAYGQDVGAQCAAELDGEAYFRISHQNSPTSPIHPKLEEIVSEIGDATDGKLRLEIFPSAQLGGPVQALEQAAFDENVIFYMSSGNLATAGVPDYSILNGPFLTPSLEAAQALASSDVVVEMAEALASKGGIRVLALNWFDSPRSILGDAAYPNPQDLEGVQMRVPEAPAYMRTFEVLKTSPMAVPFSELYLALQQGVVSAAEGGIQGMDDANLMEVADTVTVTDHFRLFYGFAMSENLFADLPDACQSLLVTQFEQKGDDYSAGMNEITAQAIEELTAEGITFVQADQEAYREATEEFYTLFPEWSEGLYERVRGAME